MLIGAQGNLIDSSDFSAFELDIHPNLVQEIPALKSDASQNRTTSEDLGENGSGEGASFSPGDVSRRIFGPDAQGVESCQKIDAESIQRQRQTIGLSGLLNPIPTLGNFDAKGTEHTVRFRGSFVEKHQHSDGWTAYLDHRGLLGIRRALPTEYLKRLDDHNEYFGDQIRIIGITRSNRFVSIQPTLRGGEPSENEIRDLLQESGWQRVPMNLQNLPAQLMGTAWWHESEERILVDARKPNFKKTPFGILPIDLVISELPQALLVKLRERLI